MERLFVVVSVCQACFEFLRVSTRAGPLKPYRSKLVQGKKTKLAKGNHKLFVSKDKSARPRAWHLESDLDIFSPTNNCKSFRICLNCDFFFVVVIAYLCINVVVNSAGMFRVLQNVFFFLLSNTNLFVWHNICVD